MQTELPVVGRAVAVSGARSHLRSSGPRPLRQPLTEPRTAADRAAEPSLTESSNGRGSAPAAGDTALARADLLRSAASQASPEYLLPRSRVRGTCPLSTDSGVSDTSRPTPECPTPLSRVRSRSAGR